MFRRYFKKKKAMKWSEKVKAGAFAGLILISCARDEYKNAVISYPANGPSGENILAMKDSSVLVGYSLYSLAAELKNNAVLKVTLTRTSDKDRAIWLSISPNSGWHIEDYDSADNSQDFISNKSGLIDVPIQFVYKEGICRLDIYENNAASPNHVINLKWKPAGTH
jgi:hypothetical protein